MLPQNHDVPYGQWQEFVTRHPGSPSLVGRVLDVHPFGAFVLLDNGIVGLLPRSVWPSAPEPGFHVTVRVAHVGSDRRISLAPA